MNIVEAMLDPLLYEPWFRGPSWAPWRAVLRAAYALPMDVADRATFHAVAERDPPLRRVRELWIVAGRRAGKDSIASLIVAHTAAMFDPADAQLRPGERAVCACLATDRAQANIVHRYVRAFFDKVPLIAPLLGDVNTREVFELTNDVDVSITTNSIAAPRGRPILAAVLDECAFWRSDTTANPDIEVFRALHPGTLTIPDSIILGISTPYGKRGLLWNKFSEHYGKSSDDVLVVRAPTWVLNPTIDRAIIDKAMEEDEVAARAEYGAEFRSDVSSFVDPETVAAAVDRGVVFRPRSESVKNYWGFVDMSGGQSDSAVLAIAHREGDMAVLDLIDEVRAPHRPDAAVAQFATQVKAYALHKVVGDRYASGFAEAAFTTNYVKLDHSERDKSDLFTEFLPVLNSGRARLLGNKRLVNQLCALERRTTVGGKDRVSHPPGGHDDVANAAAGALVLAAGKRLPIGEMISDTVLQRAKQPRWPWANRRLDSVATVRTLRFGR